MGTGRRLYSSRFCTMAHRWMFALASCPGVRTLRELEETNLRGKNLEHENSELEKKIEKRELESCQYANFIEALSDCDAFYQMWGAGYPFANDSTCDAHDVYICINVQ